jgi:hypothetical protein
MQQMIKQPHPSKISQNITNNTNSRINRDSVNITNSIIVSNSQIVFQDMGNGKLIP